MIPRLVIFDCDGVLVETESITNQVISDNLSKYGVSISCDMVGDLFAGGTMMSAGQEATRRGANLPLDWITEISDEVNVALAKGVMVIDGVIALIDLLDTKGIATAIVSNGPMAKMATSLGPSGLYTRFEGRIYSGREMVPKPAGDMLIAAMAQANATPADTVMIDDTIGGIGSARAAGTRGIGFAAHSDADKLRATGFPIATTMTEVQALLGL